MISVAEARSHVVALVPQTAVLSLALREAAGHFLAHDLHAPIDHPIFDQSAVDGYAFRFEDLSSYPHLRQVGMVQAGSAATQAVQPGECFRIFTGAPVPPGADTVVMQEYTTADGPQISIADARLKQGGNIRLRAEQIATGDLALPAGQHLDAASIGFLASLGIQEVPVHARPRVGLLITGNEFAQGPADLSEGRIFESNGQMLQAALAHEGIAADFATVRDDLPTLQAAVAEQAAQQDILVLTGGVSVGDFDFSRAALEANGFELVFHKVNQKPGKPLLVMRRGDQIAFGLPGNPRAVLMCNHMYLRPHLLARQGAQPPTHLKLPLQHDHKKRADGKTHFVTGRMQGTGVNILRGQQSHMLQSFATAQFIVELPGAQAEYPAGTLLDCHYLSL